jgi:hypothetical protein
VASNHFARAEAVLGVPTFAEVPFGIVRVLLSVNSSKILKKPVAIDPDYA